MSVETATLRLGTRRSALALAQSSAVAHALTAAGGQPVELVEISTLGDTATGAIETLGGTGVFVSALRERLLRGEIDLAVHSYKDLPTAAAPGLVIAAVPVRADPRDVLIAAGNRRLAELVPGARVGTGSPRRRALLLAARPDLDVVGLRGNVDTRIGAVTSGRLDAVVLARAGLDRLGRLGEVSEVLDPALMLPAPAQGALALECRAADTRLRDLLAELEHAPSRAVVTAERSLLAGVEAGCTAPVGALAEIDGPLLHLRGLVAAADGTRVLARSASGPCTTAHDLGRDVAAMLFAAGAANLLGMKEQ